MRYNDLGNGYWWIAGKQEVVLDLFYRYLGDQVIDGKINILDLGCGPGSLLDTLRNTDACLTGIDISIKALEICKEKGFNRLICSDTTSIPVKDNVFDAIFIIDVLEHVENDLDVVRELRRILKPGGFVCITVPAFVFLWGKHDYIYGHKRRYRLGQLAEKLRKAGFEIIQATYFEMIFLPLLFIWRKVFFFRKGDDFVKIPYLLNILLKNIIGLEKYFLRHFNMPFGVTSFVMAKAKKQDGNTPVTIPGIDIGREQEEDRYGSFAKK